MGLVEWRGRFYAQWFVTRKHRQLPW